MPFTTFTTFTTVTTFTTFVANVAANLSASIGHWAGSSQSDALRFMAQVFAGSLVKEGVRYLLGTLLLWGLLHIALRKRLGHRLIEAWPTARDIRREVAYSISSMLIFAAAGVGITALVLSGHMVVYKDPARYGWAWLLLSLPVMIVWHDLYFYFTHRWLHSPLMFRRFHGVHHRSRNPSPWAAYAFHPVEALINVAVTPIALLVLPLHFWVIVAFGMHQILRNAHGHAAVETMPRGFARHRLGRHITTTTHHHQHHETARGNYGLWFTWWDRWCGTERPDYLARFDAVTQRPAIRVQAVARGDSQAA